jgi:hypothetical protein
MTNQSRTAMTTWDRIGAACGAAYVVLILIGSSGSSNDPHPSGAKDLADFSTTPSVANMVGFTMEFLGFLVFLFFLGWLVHALRARGGAAAWLAGIAGMAGAITLAVKIASVMPMAAGRLDHKELTPSAARVLTDMNTAAFVLTFLTFGVFLIATGFAILASGYLGRVAGWTAVVIGALGVLITLLTKVDPANTNPMPFLAGLLWVLVVSIRLAWKGPRSRVPERTGDRVAVAA